MSGEMIAIVAVGGGWLGFVLTSSRGLRQSMRITTSPLRDWSHGWMSGSVG